MAAPNVNFLMLKAYIDANIISEQDQMDNYQLSDGLSRLNDIVRDLGTTNINLPYEKEFDFNLVANQAVYTFDQISDASPTVISSPPIVSLNYVNINLAFGEGTGSPWVNVQILEEGKYYLANRLPPDSVATIPNYVILRRSINTSTITFYLGPSQGYPCRLFGVFQNTSLTGTTLLSTIPEIYIKYLRYQLACELSWSYRGTGLSIEYEQERIRLYKKIQSNAYVNLTSNRNPFFNGNRTIPQPIQTSGY